MQCVKAIEKTKIGALPLVLRVIPSSAKLRFYVIRRHLGVVTSLLPVNHRQTSRLLLERNAKPSNLAIYPRNVFSSSIVTGRPYHKMASVHGKEMSIKEEAGDIVVNAIHAVTPTEMIRNAIDVEDGKLVVGDKQYPIQRNVYVAAFGKAVLGMIRAVDDLLGHHVVKGVASVPHDARETLTRNRLMHLLPLETSPVIAYEGARYNLPDEDCVNTTNKIVEMVSGLGTSDLLIVLISGGGSALFSAPQKPLNLTDVINATKILSARGATIQQLNMMRSHLESVKGGGLAQMARPASVVSLILSDVLGDPLDAIASGPTAPALSTTQACLDLLDSFRFHDVEESVKKSSLKIRTFLEAKKAKEEKEERRIVPDLDSVVGPSLVRSTREEILGSFAHVQNVIVGNNEMVVNEAVERAETLGYRSLCITKRLEGLAKERGADAAALAFYACSLLHRHGGNESDKSLVRLELDLIGKDFTKELASRLSRLAASARNSGGGICLVMGGETTVELKGDGRGGRNQEFALAAAVALSEKAKGSTLVSEYDIVIASVGTDGQDGPTDAAGAFADTGLIQACGFTHNDILRFLDNNDSYSFYERACNGDYHFKTGLTGTNVMDLQLILIKPKRDVTYPEKDLSNPRVRREFNEILE